MDPDGSSVLLGFQKRPDNSQRETCFRTCVAALSVAFAAVTNALGVLGAVPSSGVCWDMEPLQLRLYGYGSIPIN